MTFFEDIAQGLDRDGIESRVNDDTMFVPITSDLEIQFTEIDPLLPAANVYIAAADVDEDDENFEAVLVSVVFSVEDAVATVGRYVATDQVVTVLRDLLEGTDERIGDLEFFQDAVDPNLVRAEVGDNSELQVQVEVIEGVPTAVVQFIALGATYDDLVDQAIDELWESDGEATLSPEDRHRLFADLQSEAIDNDEVLDLGAFSDFDRLFDVLSLAADHAADWEEQLAPFDDDLDEEPDVYDIYGEDDEDLDEDLDGDDLDEELDEDDFDEDFEDDEFDDLDDLDDDYDEDDEDDSAND